MAKRKKRDRAKNWQGSYWERGDGRYGAEIPVLAPDGTTTYLTTTKRDEDAALKWLNDKRYERDQGILLSLESKDLTVAVYLRKWLVGSVEGTVARHTYRDYKDKVENHIIPVLGRKKLKDLTHQDLQVLYRRKAKEGLTRTVVYIHTTMSKALHEAEAADLVRKNVARFARPPKIETEEREAMTLEEVRTFLKAVRVHKDEALYLLAITSGMRRGELFALKWEENLDLAAGRYKVSHSLDTLYGPPDRKDPKRKTSRRSGILLPEVVAALKAHRQRQRHDQLRAGPRWQENGYVFPTNRGTPQRADNVLKRSLKPLCEDAGLRPLTFTDLRHSCATTLALLRVPLSTALRIMGHASEAMLLNVYTHLLDEMQEDAADRMREFLFGDGWSAP